MYSNSDAKYLKAEAFFLCVALVLVIAWIIFPQASSLEPCTVLAGTFVALLEWKRRQEERARKEAEERAEREKSQGFRPKATADSRARVSTEPIDFEAQAIEAALTTDEHDPEFYRTKIQEAVAREDDAKLTRFQDLLGAKLPDDITLKLCKAYQLYGSSLDGYGKIEEAERRKMFESAVGLLHDYLGQFPENGDAWVFLAKVERALSIEFDKPSWGMTAYELISKGIEHSPDRTDLRFYRGEIVMYAFLPDSIDVTLLKNSAADMFSYVEGHPTHARGLKILSDMYSLWNDKAPSPMLVEASDLALRLSEVIEGTWARRHRPWASKGARYSVMSLGFFIGLVTLANYFSTTAAGVKFGLVISCYLSLVSLGYFTMVYLRGMTSVKHFPPPLMIEVTRLESEEGESDEDFGFDKYLPPKRPDPTLMLPRLKELHNRLQDNSHN